MKRVLVVLFVISHVRGMVSADECKRAGFYDLDAYSHYHGLHPNLNIRAHLVNDYLYGGKYRNYPYPHYHPHPHSHHHDHFPRHDLTEAKVLAAGGSPSLANMVSSRHYGHLHPYGRSEYIDSNPGVISLLYDRNLIEEGRAAGETHGFGEEQSYIYAVGYRDGVIRGCRFCSHSIYHSPHLI
ncbi:hypothetical protein NEFER03_0259 [Nematocida sp. LUAm3]|nr:hypothetical protein NEFER03_0259 [Nematocida sp. LUAm3]